MTRQQKYVNLANKVAPLLFPAKNEIGDFD